MLKGATNIHKVESKKGYHSLVFGNESSGLPDEYLDYGKSIFIPHSHYIDSLNLSMALGMTLMHFSKDEFKDKEDLPFAIYKFFPKGEEVTPKLFLDISIYYLKNTKK